MIKSSVSYSSPPPSVSLSFLQCKWVHCKLQFISINTAAEAKYRRRLKDGQMIAINKDLNLLVQIELWWLK